MNFKTIGTGSSGNCYLFYNDKLSFIIDAGMPLSNVLNHIPCMNKFKGLFITHEHTDHAGYIKQYIDMGIEVYCSKGTAEALGLKYYNELKYDWLELSTNVFIRPIRVKHNVSEPVGFVIDAYFERTLFATDCNKILADVNHVKNFIIEANHSLSLMDRTDVNFQAYQNHMSIENSLKYINRNKSILTEQIFFIHLSSRNSNKKLFSNMTEEFTGIKPIFPNKNNDFKL